VGGTDHPHLIRLLATWHQDDCWYLLFPWADGNLRDYWSSHEVLQHEPALVKWIAKQCLGLARALMKIHRSKSDDQKSEVRDYGIHGDIKPENILWFKEPNDQNGRLVICDFGFTRFHKKETRSNARPVGISQTYRAPEFDTSPRISRSYDVWTLGCLYLEFATWYLAGLEGVNDFESRRIKDDHIDRDEEILIRQDKFFNCFEQSNSANVGNKRAEVKPSVAKVRIPQNLYSLHE
jgi:serine/threonine protein kinase